MSDTTGTAKTSERLFCDTYKMAGGNIAEMINFFKADGIELTRSSIHRRIKTLRRRNILPLESGNKGDDSTVLTGASTLFKDGKPILEWIKTSVPMQKQVEAMRDAIADIARELPNRRCELRPIPEALEDSCTLYISNDVHFGALTWAKETRDRDWDLDIARTTFEIACNHLVQSSPKSKYAIVTDLGDLTETDDFKNATPKSGNQLAVDGRYPKILKVAYLSLIEMIEKALLKHEIVYFYNIAGNHDMSTGHAIREIISSWFRNEPRVIIDTSPSSIKYHRFGSTLLQFAHGDGMRMHQAGEIMVKHKAMDYAETRFHYSHFGHNHKDSVIDLPLCRVESHRNIAPLNDWAAHHGYNRGIGTMTSITYGLQNGEFTRQTFSVSVID